MKTNIIKLSLLALLLISSASCSKETETSTPPATSSTSSSPFQFTLAGTTYSYTSSELYGLYDTNNGDVNVKTSPNADPIGVGGFSLTDLDENATAGSTQTMEIFSGANFFLTTNDYKIYSSTSGSVSFTAHDKVARTIKGTFSCTVKNSFNQSDSATVSGSFDFPYPVDYP